MLIRDEHWEKIRDRFTEEEKAILRETIVGQAISPAGVVIDFDRTGAIGRKLEKLLKGMKNAGPKR